MNYRQDKRNQKKYNKIIAFFVIVLFFIFFFYNTFFKGFAYSFAYISKPFFILVHNINVGLDNMQSYFISKKTLQKENQDLFLKLSESEAKMTNYNSLLEENIKLKENWGRKIETKKTILATILAKPNKSLYDTIVVDVGEDVGLKVDALVYAFDSIPIGRVKEVNNSTSKVVLFSTSGEKTEVVIDGQPARNALSVTPAGGDNFMELVGRGGGNFEMVIPRDFELASGTLVHLPGITPYVVAKVEDIISDPRDSLKKALLVSPVNIQNLKFVQVEK